MSDHNIRTFNTAIVQQRMQSGCELNCALRLQAAFTPAISSSVIDTDSVRLRDFRLDQRPIGGEAASSRFKDNRWTVFTNAMDMHLITVHIHKLTRGGEFGLQFRFGLLTRAIG